MSQNNRAIDLGLSSKKQDQGASGDTGDDDTAQKKRLPFNESCHNDKNNSERNDNAQSLSTFEESENPSHLYAVSCSNQVNLNDLNKSAFETNDLNKSAFETNDLNKSAFETNDLEEKDSQEKLSTHSANYSLSLSSCSDSLDKHTNSANVPNNTTDQNRSSSRVLSGTQYFSNLNSKSPTIVQYNQNQESNRINDSYNSSLVTDTEYLFDQRSHELNFQKQFLNATKKTPISNCSANETCLSNDMNKFNYNDPTTKKNILHGRSLSEVNSNKLIDYRQQCNSKNYPINSSAKYNVEWVSNCMESSPSPTSNMNDKSMNKTNLIVNYLPPYMSQEEVKALFSSVGQVESCKLVLEKSTGESLGYAFVKYSRLSDADKAIRTLNGLRLQNKTIKVSVARPSSESIKGANLYICGLPKKMTQLELEDLFNYCGHIINARILYDNKSGLSRGVAFIRFDQRHEAELAVRRFNGFQIPFEHANNGLLSEPITVKFANSPSFVGPDNLSFTLLKQAAQLQSAAATNHRNVSASAVAAAGLLNPLQQMSTLSHRLKCPGSLMGSHMSPGSVVTDLFPALASAVSVVNPLLAPAVAASSGALTASGWCIFVYNLAPETEEAHLWQLFGPFGAVQTVKIIRDQLSNKCKGFAFVTMSNYEEALLAIHSLNGFCLGDRILQVSFKTTFNMKLKTISPNHSPQATSPLSETFSNGMHADHLACNQASQDGSFAYANDRPNSDFNSIYHSKHSIVNCQRNTNPTLPSSFRPSFGEYQPKRSLLVKCPNSGVPIQLSPTSNHINNNNHNNHNHLKKSEGTHNEYDIKSELSDSFSGALTIKSTPLSLNSKSCCQSSFVEKSKSHYK